MRNLKTVLFVMCALFMIVGTASANVNPFMDVPMGHWAYDSITHLSARGVVAGYPDGTFKGDQPSTRYEIASVLARTLAVVDMTKASKQDVEMLKRLVVEFKSELDALGVKVSELDSRVAVLEDNLGGWKFWGEFRMDAKFADKDAGLYTASGKSNFDINRARIWMSKRVDDKVTFTTRFGMRKEYDPFTGNENDTANFDLVWLDVAMPWDIAMKVGKWQVDWSAADGTYGDNDSMFSNRIMKGFYFSKPWSHGEVAGYVSREDSSIPGSPDETMEYGVRGRVDVSENVWASANYMKRQYDGNVPNVDLDESVLWGTLGAKFVPGVEGRFSYYSQKNGNDVALLPNAVDRDSKAWHMSIDVAQEKLGGFSSFRAEYLKPDENFRAWTDGPWDAFGAKVTGKELGRYDNVMFISAEQKWNNQWTTFERYLKGSARWNNIGGLATDDTSNWSIGVRHYYTPALTFELAYDKIENSETLKDNSDHLIRFRTHVAF